MIEFPPEGRFPTSSPYVRNAVYAAFGGIDFYTGRPLAKHEMSIDHIVPRSLGGEDNVFNYIPTRQSINSAKCDKYDPISAAPLLHIVRVHFAPRVLRLISEAKSARARRELRRRGLGISGVTVDEIVKGFRTLKGAE